MTKTESVARLSVAVEQQNANGIENALIDAFRVGLDSMLAPYLITLISAPWHTRHEDVALALQELKCPEAVEALYGAALCKYPYLEYDNSQALARRCTWALADIGTPEAKAALESVALSSDQLVASYAQARLDRWENERARKGA